jgi:hypothetical protein
MGLAPKIDWEPIKAMFIAGKTAREIATIFNIHPASIGNKAHSEKWGALRKQVRALPPTKDPALDLKVRKPPSDASKVAQEMDFQLSSADSSIKADSNDAVSRAIRLRNSDSFRDRVVAQADKALSTLEKATISNVFETDRFAEALTKVERIGARAYGYDREGDHPIVNIGILGSGAEYEPAE